ncbi:DUF4393 domain-containing protein [Psychrobacillus psychrodurans]|uniref:DUF4393 domain-containing protein n=1 Tax=Psychrobacillus psychrodurans TaxID=126157 RepID=UPI0008EBEA18|nr:DUF4393 domain-containing protein [Psychrobacillus psychrodurans]MCZ8541955.1 DUF4393 domain-containing protein [Psychrobacillus psychrodurans]SFN14173.1 protein of unknown function [Psychrobacillus psychrodurans]
MEINILPKFIDEAATPVAQSVGNTVSGVWNLVFGNHVSLWLKKQEYKHQLNYEDFVEKVNAKVENILPENIIEPEMHILGPAIEASKYYIHSEELRDMFANLIAASMDSEKENTVHPSYVEIIKQLAPDEAKILKHIKGNHFPTIKVISQIGSNHSPILENFSDVSYKVGCEFPNNVHSYLDNLNRLGLINLYNEGRLTDDTFYEDIENHPVTKQSIEIANSLGESKIIRTHAAVTMFGKNFYESCIK